jgi:hypothetical protein
MIRLATWRIAPVSADTLDPAMANATVFLDVDHEDAFLQATSRREMSGFGQQMASIAAGRSRSKRGCVVPEC